MFTTFLFLTNQLVNEWRVQIPTLFYMCLCLNLQLLNRSVRGNLPEPFAFGGMRKHILLLMCILWGGIGYAQVVNPLDSMRLQFNQDVARMRSEFEEYEAQARADFNRYVDSIKSVWGGDTIVDNTKKVWVEYGKDYRSRSVVDFENGNISVEIAVDESEKQNAALINQRLVEAVEQMLNSRGSSNLYQSTDGVSNPILDRPALEGLVDFSMYDMDSLSYAAEKQTESKRPAPPMPTVKGKELSVSPRNISQEVVSKKDGNLAKKRKQERLEAERRKKELEAKQKKPKIVNNAAVAKKVVAQSQKKTVSTKGADGKEREIVKVEMALVSDRISKSATLYKDLVAEFSAKYQVEQPLIFAIIETESAFNPKAVSVANAYGLMQLIPTSGGRDAYQYVYKEDRIPKMNELFNPRFNIQLGTAYLRVLSNRLSKITDPHCRRLCVIASYNGGEGGMYQCLIGTSKNRTKGQTYINQFDYEGLYGILTTKLFSETRDYVAKVTKRREKYMKQ